MERFYARNLPLSKEMAINLQSFGSSHLTFADKLSEVSRNRSMHHLCSFGDRLRGAHLDVVMWKLVSQ